MKVSSEFRNDAGIPFCAVLVEPGEPYGNIVHGMPRLVATAPLVEFYDCRYPHTDFGQFVTRYRAEDLILWWPHGLILDGGIADWRISAANMATVNADLNLTEFS